MAYTVSLVVNSVFGNKRVAGYRIAADAASATVQTPLNNIELIQHAPVSMTTSAIRFEANEASAGTATAGMLHIENATSGDVFYVTVYGK
jgi:hypothetical protein